MIHLLWASLAIPVIIHLVYRRKAKPMPFSTLYFLQQIDQRVQRRYRLKEILLLLARLALLAALVGALERPMLRSSTFKGSGVPTTAAVVLDNTYSMRAVDEGSTAFSRAKKAADAVLKGLTSKDSAVLTLVNQKDTSTTRPTTAVGRLRAQLSEMACSYGSGELGPALKRALDSVEEGKNERREIYVLTDMQRLSWSPALEQQGQRLAEDFPDTPVFLVDVGNEVTENLTVTKADFGNRVNVRGTNSQLYCELENTSTRNLAKNLSMYLDGEKTQEQEVGLASGGKRSVVFQHVFERKGNFQGRVEIAPDDLPADNRWYFTVDVHEQVPVLVINGSPSVIPYKDSAFFLRLALQGKTSVGRQLSPIDPTIVTVRELQSVRLSDYAGVILANVPRISDRMKQDLSTYVRGGGGVMVFLGDNVDAASYNMAIGASATSATRRVSAEGEETAPAENAGLQLLPGNLQGIRSSEKGQDFFRIWNVNARHPVFRDIIDELELQNAQVRTFFDLQQPDANDDGGVSLLSMETGPLLIEKKVGAGTVVLCTTACTPGWSNIPLKPFFLPVLHQLVYYMGGPSSRQVSTPVGMAYRLRIPDTREPVEVKFYPPTPPQQSEDEEPPEPVVIRSEVKQGANSAVFEGTHRPGIYRADIQLDQRVLRRFFAVNIPTRESNLSRLPVEEAGRRLGVDNLLIVGGPDELGEIVTREREGLPLWDYLLLATIAIAVLETFISNVLLKPTGEESS